MSLDPQIARTLTVASGYSELGLFQDALAELATLPASERGRAEVACLQLGIFIGLRQWERAAALAESMLALGSTEGAAYQLGAYAIRRCRSLSAARAFLLLGEFTQQQNPIWHFNLACYECQLGHLEAALRGLESAFKLLPKLRTLAREEEDLRPLWPSLIT